MKARYRLFKRRNGIFFIQDNASGKQESLRTRDKIEAKQFLAVSNEVHRQPAMNLQIAQIYLRHSDPALSARTWQNVMDQIVATKSGETLLRWQAAIRDHALDLIRDRKLIETTAEHFLALLKDGTVSTNVYLRRRELYERSKAALLKDKAVCLKNQKLFAEFFRFEEYKLKRIRGNAVLDENSYKTLLSYTQRLKTVNRWFKNKSWHSLTKVDIQRVYDDLEDGKILGLHTGKPIRDKRSFYKLVIRGKPFEMAGKKELVREVMQFVPSQDVEEVRFITEENFRRLLKFVNRPMHRLFLWLCWDIGENARSILQLRKEDCNRRQNDHLAEPEYLINLRKDILKRSRRSRSELTNYKETVEYLDDHLKLLADGNLLFHLGAAGAHKFLVRAAQKAGVRCQPGGQRVTLKDLRSSMACDLLSKGWSRDEVNARLGHAPSSRIIDKYINYLAIDRVRPKQKFQDNQVSRLSFELAEVRNREKLVSQRLEQLQRASDAKIAYLNGLVEIQSKIATLQIDRIQKKLTEQEFARALAKYYDALTALIERQPSPTRFST